QLNLLLRRLGVLQIDSVNVFERSHYLIPFARLGAYDRTLLDRLTVARKAPHVEYLAHEAAFVPVSDWPLFRWRMRRFRDQHNHDWVESNPDLIGWLLKELEHKGPLRASEIEHDANERRGNWWGWSDVKMGLEILLRRGLVVCAGRTRFERAYGLPEHVLPGDVLNAEIPEPEAQRRLIEQAALALGVASATDLADYYRMSRADTNAAVAQLVDGGVLNPVTVQGWKDLAYLHRDTTVSRKLSATALLSPFDPIVWDRPRTERMFNFHYRIEIYTPEPKRQFGYYSLPILIDDAIAGRIDLKSDRRAGVLRVQSAWLEDGNDGGYVAERIRPVLESAAAWQGLETIEVVGKGTLSPWL
ncbi:MAG TPA: crosslink repair DNA glycosylase YcaQ family protein, partial [Terrimesophilobacter sp.]|nr:crosslink repair DNA glycosylase YcaQ family protein [Terrimesophilobacter sp.]